VNASRAAAACVQTAHEEVAGCCRSCNLHGWPGRFDLALRGLLGAGAPLSAPSIARSKRAGRRSTKLWKTRVVEDLDVVYLWWTACT